MLTISFEKRVKTQKLEALRQAGKIPAVYYGRKEKSTPVTVSTAEFLKNMKKTRGFTLIELLVVISIIGLLSSIVLASLNVARAKARDSVRLQNAHQLNNALELYIAENGEAPAFTASNRTNATSVEKLRWEELAILLKKYLSPLPQDPCVTGCAGAGGKDLGYVYTGPAQSGRTDFTVSAKFEKNSSVLMQVGS